MGGLSWVRAGEALLSVGIWGFTTNSFLARSANLPDGLYIILLALISVCLSFFNDRSEPDYLRIYWIDFRDLCTK